jgi:MFS family permease
MQAVLPGIVMCLILFFPESPRWLIHKDRTEDALAVLTKYHGAGDPQAPLVQLEYREILEDRQNNPSDDRWWDFRELIRDRQSRYRTLMVISISFIGQWSGNNVVSYFFVSLIPVFDTILVYGIWPMLIPLKQPAMVKNAGIEDTNTQLLLNAINPVMSYFAAVFGSAILDKFGRRVMMMSALAGCNACFILLTAFTAHSYNINGLAYGVIVSIYLYAIIFSIGMNPCQTLYATECLENRTRAKGTSLKFLSVNIAMIINTYGIAVGIDKIGWKLYLVYDIWIAIEIVFMYFTFPETANKTLEELGHIFNAKNPRKESTKKTKVQIYESGHVVEVEPAQTRV